VVAPRLRPLGTLRNSHGRRPWRDLDQLLSAAGPLLAVGRVFACILVHTMVLGRRSLRAFSIHRRGRSGGAARSSDRLSHFVSNRLTWLAEAGGLAILAAGKPSECQLTQQADQAVANPHAGARIGGHVMVVSVRTTASRRS
jgi:hypothetical protein